MAAFLLGGVACHLQLQEELRTILGRSLDGSGGVERERVGGGRDAFAGRARSE